MSVRIQVIHDEKPVVGVRVFVSWVSGGHSERRTDSNGIADLGTNPATAEYVQVEGRKVLGETWLKDGINQVSRY